MAFAIFRAKQREIKGTPVREEEWFNNGFKQIWESGVYITNTSAKRLSAIEMLNDDGLRLMTPKEALEKISQRPYLRNKLEGKVIAIEGRGSIGGNGIFDGRDGLPVHDCYTFNDKGELSPGKGYPENTTHIYRGRHPLALYIPTTNSVENIGANFIIYANQGPSYVLSIIAGVKKENKPFSQAQQVPEDSRITFDSLLRVA